MRKRQNIDGGRGGNDLTARSPSVENVSPPTSEGEKVLLARILTAHGLRGEVKILTFTEVPENIAVYGPLTTRDGRTFRIESLRAAKGEAVIARLSGVSDRTVAEALRGTELFVSRDQLPAPDAEEWYYSDLIGLKAQSPEGVEVGKVIAVHDFGAGDLLEIRPVSGKAILLAFTQDNVPAVNTKNGCLTVILPEEIVAEGDDGTLDDAKR
jgi:16S rRNA processing protein RimM